jgi:hypothetical protein
MRGEEGDDAIVTKLTTVTSDDNATTMTTMTEEYDECGVL